MRILNLDWEVPLAQPDQGVWATLEFTLQGATLRIFDAAPDALERTRLAEYDFPLTEEVQPLANVRFPWWNIHFSGQRLIVL